MEENQTAKKPMNKTEIFAALAETTGLTKQQVGSLFDELSKLIGKAKPAKNVVKVTALKGLKDLV